MDEKSDSPDFLKHSEISDIVMNPYKMIEDIKRHQDNQAKKGWQ